MLDMMDSPFALPILFLFCLFTCYKMALPTKTADPYVEREWESVHRNLRSMTRFCHFCEDVKPYSEFVTKTTSNCRHTPYRICVSCLHGYIIATEVADIRCPLEPAAESGDGSLTCGSLFELYDIRKLLNTTEYSR